MISTIEIINLGFKQEEADGWKCFSSGIIHGNMLNEAYRLRTSRTLISKFRKGMA